MAPRATRKADENAYEDHEIGQPVPQRGPSGAQKRALEDDRRWEHQEGAIDIGVVEECLGAPKAQEKIFAGQYSDIGEGTHERGDDCDCDIGLGDQPHMGVWGLRDEIGGEIACDEKENGDEVEDQPIEYTLIAHEKRRDERKGREGERDDQHRQGIAMQLESARQRDGERDDKHHLIGRRLDDHEAAGKYPQRDDEAERLAGGTADPGLTEKAAARLVGARQRDGQNAFSFLVSNDTGVIARM